MNPTEQNFPRPVRARGRTVAIALGLAGLAAALVACGSDDAASSDTAPGTAPGTVTVEDAWIREPAAGQTAAAAYATVVNGTDHEVTLVGASSPGFDHVSVHETTMAEDGTMSMGEPEGGFPIAAGATFVLDPGGAHVMFEDVDATQFAAPVEVTFVFDDGTDAGLEVTAEAEIRSVDDSAEMPMDTEMPMGTGG